MRIVNQGDIESLNIPDVDILSWVRQAFLLKKESMLPHKISQTFNEGRNFYNTMPAIVPSLNVAGVKVVSRYPDRKPSIKGDLLLYRFSDGESLALMDATWITSRRTGAVAALAVETFARKDFDSVAVVGLGQTGLSFLDMFLCNPLHCKKRIKLMKYKDHAEITRSYLLGKGVSDVVICSDYESLIRDSDVIVSALTVADGQIGQDEWFKEGCLVVPIHTRGFQNCDLFFDKVFADDRSHVDGFKYFDKFQYFDEIDIVLSGIRSGRTNDKERILSYNIGIALHDIVCAYNIYERL